MSSRVIDGVGLPDDSSLTNNERAWIDLLRLVSEGSDPRPTLHATQALRRLLSAA